VRPRISAQAACAALFARDRVGGRGQTVTIDMAQAASHILLVDGYVNTMWAGSEEMPSFPEVGDVYGQFCMVCKDADERGNKKKCVIITVTNPEVQALIKVIESAGPDVMSAEDLEQLKKDTAPGGKWDTLLKRLTDFHALVAYLKDVIVKFASEDLAVACWREGVPCMPVCEPDKVFEDPQILHNGTLMTLETQHGRQLLPIPPAIFPRSPCRIRRGAPAPGEHSQVDHGGAVILHRHVLPFWKE
jgi:crotonobetainyl-CoA:carnitine CoA-transferase CaiB-like acyl-CoA transferase